jgi:hypothetical protein
MPQNAARRYGTVSLREAREIGSVDIGEEMRTAQLEVGDPRSEIVQSKIGNRQ